MSVTSSSPNPSPSPLFPFPSPVWLTLFCVTVCPHFCPMQNVNQQKAALDLQGGIWIQFFEMSCSKSLYPNYLLDCGNSGAAKRARSLVWLHCEAEGFRRCKTCEDLRTPTALAQHLKGVLMPFLDVLQERVEVSVEQFCAVQHYKPFLLHCWWVTSNWYISVNI